MLFFQNKIIQDDQTYDYTERLNWFFERLVSAIGTETFPYKKSALKRVTETVKASAELYPELPHLPTHENYSRCVLGQHGDLNALLIKWSEGAISSVHGHPSLAYYYVLKGECEMDFYEKISPSEIRYTKTQKFKAGDCIWKQGESGHYDNMIHRVRVTKECYTLHLFEGNPINGEVFPQP